MQHPSSISWSQKEGQSSRLTLNGRLTSITHNLTSGAKRFDYGYDEVNNLRAVRRDGNLGDWFDYDETREIKSFKHDGAFPASRPMPAAEILGESDTMIFSATTANGIVLRAQAHDFDGKNRALIEIGDGLVQYCDVPSSARAGVARKIEEAATVLFNRTQQDQERKRR